jgi:hypothetical protein
MTDDTVLLERVRDAFRADLRIGFDDHSIVLSLSGGDLGSEGGWPMSRSKGARCAKPPKSSKAGSLSTGRMSGPRRQWKMALGECISPDIREIDWSRDCAVQLLGYR